MRRSPATAILVSSILVLAWLGQAYSQPAPPAQLSNDIGLALSKVLSSQSPSIMSLTTQFLFGIQPSNNNQGQSQSMIIDLNFNQIYVADATTSTFGFTCDQSVSCSSDGAPQQLPAYGSLTPQGKKATTFMRFDGSTSTGSSMPSSMDFYLATFNSDWMGQYSKNGVFGFGPSSPVWAFIKSAYSVGTGGMDVTLHLQVKDSSDIYDLSKVEYSSSSKVVVNDQSTSDSVFGPPVIYQAGSVWALFQSTIRFSKSFTSEATNVCIDSASQSFFMISSKYYTQVVQNIFQQLCGSTTGCKKSNTRVADLDNIVLTVPSEDGSNTYTLTLLGKQFVNFDSDENTLVGIVPLESSNICNLGATDFAVGRLLLNMVDVTVRMVPGQSSAFRIGVRDASSGSKQEWKQVLVMSAVSLALAGLVTLYLVKMFLRPESDLNTPINQ